ncbi:unnamed protein product, partial [Mesorhabditis spiculigera]
MVSELGGSSNRREEEKERLHEEISAQEREIYDRQIRLWGMEAQNKLRNASVLVIGLSGLGAEIVKNLMLAGLNALTIMDDKKATADDKKANFLLPDADYAGQNRAMASAERASALNPMVKLNAIPEGVQQHGKETWKQYSLVILCDQGFEESCRVDEECRDLGVRFMCGAVFGGAGYSFFDFDGHDFLVQIKNIPYDDLEGDDGNKIDDEMTTIEEDRFEKKKFSYAPLRDAFSVDWTAKKYIRKVSRYLPQMYYPIKACIAQLGKGDFTDAAQFKDSWLREVEAAGQSASRFTYEDDDFETFFGAQMSPVCAIVGGIMGQETIKAIAEDQHPLRNLFTYTMVDTVGMVTLLPPA